MPVAGPLALAGLLLVFERLLPRRVLDAIAIAAAAAAALACAVMAVHAAGQPLVYWFGGWGPRGGQVLGIAFVVDQAGAGLAAFIGLLFAMTFVFALGFFDDIHAHFHVLMLLFMAGMIGFCLTHDLFNMFVWFEVMSVAAFALTGYQLRSSALEGALNFTVVNTIGSYLILAGIGVLYAKAGALDFTALAQAVRAAPADPVVYASFTLLACGFLIKAAQAPFQFWLSDAHAVAPSPVSVIFSGAMVSLGLFGVLRMVFEVFAFSPGVAAVAHTLLLGMGAVTAVVGGLMALVQRHIKRLLAFSTIAHTGILLMGLSLRGGDGLPGMMVYLVGHGLVKAALFMVAGILMATRGGIDELGLQGLGKGIWPVGVVMAAGGLLLAGLPWGMLDTGTAVIGGAALQQGQGWVAGVILAGAGLTGAAVLRAAGRVFLGLGPEPDEDERNAPSEQEQEKANRPVWLMMLPTTALLLLALAAPERAAGFAQHAAGWITQHRDLADLPPLPHAPDWLPWASVALACAIAGWQLGRSHLPRGWTGGTDALFATPVRALQKLHSGQVGDYVAWVATGMALLAGAFALAG